MPRRVLALLMATLLVAGQVPVLPEVPHALAQDGGATVELGGDDARALGGEDAGAGGPVVAAPPENGLTLAEDGAGSTPENTESVVAVFLPTGRIGISQRALFAAGHTDV